VHLVAHGPIKHFGHACGRITVRDRLESRSVDSPSSRGH
jgi:hypothetical protein